MAAALVPGALTFYLAFSTGGFFPGTTALATLAVLAGLILRIALADDPFEGLSRPLLLVAGALLAYALWTLASGAWSGAWSRALLDFQRVLLYLLTLLLFGCLRREDGRVRWMVRGLAIATTAVSLAGLATRVLPAVFPLSEAYQIDRLSYPIGYWNALGLLAAVGIILCLHLTSDPREPRAGRALGAGALPILGATLLFTFSRGPMVAVAVGLIAYVALGRPRLLPAGLVASVPAVLAVLASYSADLLAAGGAAPDGSGAPKDPTIPAAVVQGHRLAAVLVACAAAGAALRLLLAPLDRRLSARDPFAWVTGRGAARAAGAVAAVAVVVVGVGVGTGDKVGNLVTSGPTQTGDERDRLTEGGLARGPKWDVAIEAFRGAPIIGQGAGTYELSWARTRTEDIYVLDAHSLYLESLGELGAVGLGLILLCLGGALGVMVTRARGPERALYAALAAAVGAWMVHSAVDWNWELPAVTLWLFAAAGTVLAGPGRERGARAVTPVTRVVAAAGCVLLAAFPVIVGLSQVPLVKAERAYQRGDCSEATDAARGTISLLGERPEPYELIGFCAADEGRHGDAVSAMAKAADRDPDNWEYRYGEAIVRAQAGLDPRPDIARALRLNPREPVVRYAVRRLGTARAASWRRQAAEVTRYVRCRQARLGGGLTPAQQQPGCE